MSVGSVFNTHLNSDTLVMDDKIKQLATWYLSQVEKTRARINIPFVGKEKEIFRDWFYFYALFHKDAALIVAEFEEQDWEWLRLRLRELGSEQERHNFDQDILPSAYRFPSTSTLTTFAMDWMANIGSRLTKNTLLVELNRGYCDDKLWHFFHFASHTIDVEEGWKKLFPAGYNNFFKSFTLSTLLAYFDAFHPNLQKVIIENIKKYYNAELIALFGDDFPVVAISIVRECTPDWKTQLADWVRVEMQKCKEQSRGERPSYDSIVRVYNFLSRDRQLTQFLGVLDEVDSYDFRRDVKDIFTQYHSQDLRSKL